MAEKSDNNVLHFYLSRKTKEDVVQINHSDGDAHGIEIPLDQALGIIDGSMVIVPKEPLKQLMEEADQI